MLLNSSILGGVAISKTQFTLGNEITLGKAESVTEINIVIVAGTTWI